MRVCVCVWASLRWAILSGCLPPVCNIRCLVGTSVRAKTTKRGMTWGLLALQRKTGSFFRNPGIVSGLCRGCFGVDQLSRLRPTTSAGYGWQSAEKPDSGVL